MKDKFSAAFAGIAKGLRHRAVLTQFILAAMAVCAGFILRLGAGEWAAVIVCIGLVITAEMLNTCIEKLCDLYTDEFDPRIGLIKDIAAGAVLTASVTALATALVILWQRL